MRKPINIELIREATENLKRIAEEYPELIDHNQAQWTEVDIQAMIEGSVVKPVYSLTEAASLLQCHVETLRRAIRSNKLKAARVGRQYKISKSDLEDYYSRQGGGALFK